MKRILHIAQSAGGVERYIQTLLNCMDKKNWNHVLIISKDFNLGKARELTNEVIVIPMEREISLLKDISQILKLRKIIKQINPDIIYLHSSKAGALGRVAAVGLKKVIVYNAHGWSFNMQISNLKKMMYIFIEQFLSLFCNKIIAISDYERKSALSRKIVSERKIVTIYNGIQMEDNQLISNSYSDQFYHIGMVGRLDIQKAPDIFVKAAYEIKKIIPNAFFTIVGDGKLRKDVEELISSYSLENCFNITGWVDNPREYIEKFDIAMLLSRWEGFGLVIAEYMYLKKPIIATNVDAIPELIHDEKNGIIVTKDNVQEIVSAVKRYYTDESFRNKVIENSYNDVQEKFNGNRMARDHEKLFESLFH